MASSGSSSKIPKEEDSLHEYRDKKCSCQRTLKTRFSPSSYTKSGKRRKEHLNLCHYCHTKAGRRYCSACNNYKDVSAWKENEASTICNKCRMRKAAARRRKLENSRENGENASSAGSSPLTEDALSATYMEVFHPSEPVAEVLEYRLRDIAYSPRQHVDETLLPPPMEEFPTLDDCIQQLAYPAGNGSGNPESEDISTAQWDL